MYIIPYYMAFHVAKIKRKVYNSLYSLFSATMCPRVNPQPTTILSINILHSLLHIQFQGGRAVGSRNKAGTAGMTSGGLAAAGVQV